MISNLEDGLAYTTFLNDLKNENFKFFLAEHKETTLVEALWKAVDFIRVSTICTENSNVIRSRVDDNA